MDEVDDGSFLLAAGFDDGEHGFDVTVASFALGAETQFSPDDSVTQAAFGSVVGRFDVRVFEKRPQVVSVVVQLFAHAVTA